MQGEFLSNPIQKDDWLTRNWFTFRNALPSDQLSAKINELWENPVADDDVVMEASSAPAPQAPSTEDAEMAA